MELPELKQAQEKLPWLQQCNPGDHVTVIFPAPHKFTLVVLLLGSLRVPALKDSEQPDN